MKRILAGLALTAMMFATGASASVTYSFSSFQMVDTGPVDPNDPDGDQVSIPVNRSFTITTANFITDGEFTWDACSIDQPDNTCNTTMTFDAGPNVHGANGEYVGFNNLFDDGMSMGSGTAFYFFAPGAFSAVGVYSTADNDPGGNAGNAGLGQLRVTSSDVLAVPEPTTWALMILGFGTVGAMLRRRRQSDTFAGT